MTLVNQQNIINAVYSFINTSIGSSNPSGQLIDIYEAEAQQNASLPLCIYQIVTDTPLYHMNDESLDCDIQVSFFGWKKNGSKALRTISDTLINDLDRNQINITGYDNEIVFITNRGVISIVDDVIEIRTEFRLKGF